MFSEEFSVDWTRQKPSHSICFFFFLKPQHANQDYLLRISFYALECSESVDGVVDDGGIRNHEDGDIQEKVKPSSWGEYDGVDNNVDDCDLFLLLVTNPVTKSNGNDNEHKKSIFHKRNIATRASIITMYSNNDLDHKHQW